MVPQGDATSVCNLFFQLGVRGISVLFASGDPGVGGRFYLSNNGPGSNTQLIPVFRILCLLFFSSNTCDLHDVVYEGPYQSYLWYVSIEPRSSGQLLGGGYSNCMPHPACQDS
jgi:hypothetical protein